MKKLNKTQRTGNTLEAMACYCKCSCVCQGDVSPFVHYSGRYASGQNLGLSKAGK